MSREIPTNLPHSVEKAILSGSFLKEVVSPLVLNLSGLNKDPQVTAVNSFLNASYESTLPFTPGRVMNTFIVCRKTGDRSAEWFFDSFESKPARRRSEEEEDEYQKRKRGVPMRSNRKTARELDCKRSFS